MPEQMGVWAWDQDAVLPGNEIPESYIKVFTSNKFNPSTSGFLLIKVNNSFSSEESLVLK